MQLLQTFQFGEDEQDMSEAMQDAVSFMVEKQVAIVGWRQNQVRELKALRRASEHVHQKVKQYAGQNGAPQNVRDLTGPLVRKDGVRFRGFHFGLLCIFIDALDWPDDKLAYNLAMGFPVLHNIPDSGVYRRIASDMDDASAVPKEYMIRPWQRIGIGEMKWSKSSQCEVSERGLGEKGPRRTSMRVCRKWKRVPGQRWRMA